MKVYWEVVGCSGGAWADSWNSYIYNRQTFDTVTQAVQAFMMYTGVCPLYGMVYRLVREDGIPLVVFDGDLTPHTWDDWTAAH